MVNLAEADPAWLFCLYSPENFPTVGHLVKLVEKRVRKPFNRGPTERMTTSEYASGAAWVLEHFLWLETDLKIPEALLTRRCPIAAIRIASSAWCWTRGTRWSISAAA